MASWQNDWVRFLRASWRLVSVSAHTLAHTLYLDRTAKRLPPAQRVRYRTRRQQVGCALLCRILNLHVTVDGQLPDDGGMLVVCNHFGVLDPIVLASKMPVALVGKAEMRDWPVIGWVTRTMGVIFVERERRMQTGTFLEEVQAKLREGVSVLVFPEGTTGRSETVMPFKTGVFEAVVGMRDRAVLPLYLGVQRVEGKPAVGQTRDVVVWADNTQRFTEAVWRLMGLRRVDMQIRVGGPIPIVGHDRKALARLAHARLTALSQGAPAPPAQAS